MWRVDNAVVVMVGWDGRCPSGYDEGLHCGHVENIGIAVYEYPVKAQMSTQSPYLHQGVASFSNHVLVESSGVEW